MNRSRASSSSSSDNSNSNEPSSATPIDIPSSSYNSKSNSQKEVIRKGRRLAKQQFTYDAITLDEDKKPLFMKLEYNPQYELACDPLSAMKYYIRKVGTSEIIEPYINMDGLACITINNKEEYLHAVISQQIYKGSKSSSKVPKREYEYLDELPPRAFRINTLDGVDINERYFFDPEEEIILLQTARGAIRYKLVNIRNVGASSRYYHLLDRGGSYHSFSYYKVLPELKARSS